MKIVRLPPTDAAGWSKLEGWCKGLRVGLVLEFEAAMAGNRVLWCTHLAAGQCSDIDDFVGLLLVIRGVAARSILLEAIFEV